MSTDFEEKHPYRLLARENEQSLRSVTKKAVPGFGRWLRRAYRCYAVDPFIGQLVERKTVWYVIDAVLVN